MARFGFGRWNGQNLGRSYGRPSTQLRPFGSRQRSRTPLKPRRAHLVRSIWRDQNLGSRRGLLFSRIGALRVVSSSRRRIVHLTLRRYSYRRRTYPCAPSRSPRTDLASSLEITRFVSSSRLVSSHSVRRDDGADSLHDTGSRLRLDDPTRTHVHGSTTENEIPSSFAIPHQSPRLARYKVRLPPLVLLYILTRPAT